MTKIRNRQRVFVLRPGRVPQKNIVLVDLVRAVVLVGSFFANTCFSLLTPFNFRHRCLYCFSFISWFLPACFLFVSL